MRYPHTLSATELKNWHILEEYEPGRWRPARPCSYKPSWHNFAMQWRRVKIAWDVFIGRRDAVHWGDQSGEWSNHEVNYRDCTHPEWRKTPVTG